MFLLFLSVARVANLWLSFEAGRKRDFCLYKVGRPIPMLVCEQVVDFVLTATMVCLIADGGNALYGAFPACKG
jgi:hypothetical protein